MLSSWQNGGLSRQLYSPALGTVNTSLQSLADSTQTVEQNWQFLLQNHGQPLMACIDSVEKALSSTTSTKADIKRLQNTIENTKAALQDSESDVIRLRGKTGSVVEDARAQVAALGTEASKLRGTITSQEQEKRIIESSIDNTEALIKKTEAEARTLDDAAKTQREGARGVQIGGAFWTAVGLLAAPFTSGISLGLSVAAVGTGIGSIVVGEFAAGDAEKLRRSAESQRKLKYDLQSQAMGLESGKSQLQNQLANKKQALQTVEGYQRTVVSVMEKLNRFGTVLSAALENMQDIEVALDTLSRSGDCVTIIQDSFTQKSYAYLPRAARRTFDDFLFQCRDIRGFLTQMGIPTSTSIQYINANDCFIPAALPPNHQHTYGIPDLPYPTQRLTRRNATPGPRYQPAPLPPSPPPTPNQIRKNWKRK